MNRIPSYRSNENGSHMPMGSLFAPTGDLRADIRQLLAEDEAVGRPCFDQHLGGQFLRISGIAIDDAPMTADARKQHGREFMRELLTGLHGQHQTCIYAVVCKDREVKVYMSLALEERARLAEMLRGTFPGIWLEEASTQQVSMGLEDLPYCAVMRGIPSPRERDGNLNRLLQALAGVRWGYVVLARPLARQTVAATVEGLAQEIQRVRNAYLRLSTVEQDNNPLARYYVDLLEAAFNQYKAGRVEGCWETLAFILGDSEATLHTGMALLTSIFSGEKSLPSPVRLRQCSPDQPASVSPTVLNTPGLSLFVELPTVEMPGYRVDRPVSFATALPQSRAGQCLVVGRTLQHSVPTGHWLQMPIEDLTKHVLVTGMTGSGKTETCQFLLDQLWREHGIPYLVVEPAKREYRGLKRVDGHEAVRVFTAGNESGTPLRINPFEVPEGTHVQTHIDYLRSLFNASFAGLYPPMPYMLEQAIYGVYVSAGWDLTTGHHGRERRFPTISDFCEEVEDTVQGAGYDAETTQNVATALRVRLNSLRLGAKGTMLNTASSTPFQEIVSAPTVLELASIGDPDVTAFLMGLVLVRLYEHFSATETGSALRHITLMEEAHHLLAADLRGQGNIEVSNVRGRAMELFCNMLAEVRAYGECLIIVDQSPTKLHPDAVKGTNLKIIHRLVAEDDRQAVAGSTTMDSNQKAFLAALKTGQGVVYAEGFSRPYLVSVPAFRRYALDQGAGEA